jgi:co-chaperonin GroES (HSP10)
MRRNDIESKIFSLKLRPARRDGVILLRDEIAESVSPGGIIIPDVGQDRAKHRHATVISIGTDVREISSGDRVLVSAFCGIEIKHDDSHLCKMVLVSQDQIDAVIDE